MSRSGVIYTFAQYEIRRAIARKKVLALVAFTFLLGTLPYYALSAAKISLIPNSAYPYIWVIGIFAVGSLFINFTAILIAAGAMSEEYEQGTAELLLSKPVRRSDYFTGKFLGGYVLFLSILALNIFLSVASAITFFGAQNSLNIIPGLFLAQAFSSLVFYSLAFMLGELVRRSSLAYIFSSAVFFSSFIISAFMGLIYTLTGEAIYKTVQIYLPTSPADSLPIQYTFPKLPQSLSTILRFINTTTPVPTIELSIEILLIYTLSAIAIAVVYFLRADISRKLS
jgi:ABC-2 type transport system permease protein